MSDGNVGAGGYSYSRMNLKVDLVGAGGGGPDSIP